MANSKVVSTTTLLILAALVYVFFSFKPNQTFLALVVAIGAYFFTKDTKAVLGTLIGAILVVWLTNVLKPTAKPVFRPFPITGYEGFESNGEKKKEGFQPKDPLSIHQRITEQKTEQPLGPKTQEITGVLESPDILDNLQVSELHPSEYGATAGSRPAGSKGHQRIATPAESSMPPDVTSDRPPKPAVNLFNGPDLGAIFTALLPKGSAKVDTPAQDMPGADVGPAMA